MSNLKWEWGPADSAAAEAEGWNVFDSSERGLEIERVDAPGENGDQPPVFADDALAIGHVYCKAQEGSALHQKALAITLHAMKAFAQQLPQPNTQNAIKRPDESDEAAVDRVLGIADQFMEDWRKDAQDGGDPKDQDLVEREAEWHYWRPRILACVNACAGIPTVALAGGGVPALAPPQLNDSEILDLAEASGFDLAEDVQPHLSVWGWGDEHGNGATRFESERDAAMDALETRYGEIWRHEVAHGNTRRSFIDFCQQAVEESQHENRMKP